MFKDSDKLYLHIKWFKQGLNVAVPFFWGLGCGEAGRHRLPGKGALLAVVSCEEQRCAEVMSKHTGLSRAAERRGTGNTSALPLIQPSAAQHATHLRCPLSA